MRRGMAELDHLAQAGTGVVDKAPMTNEVGGCKSIYFKPLMHESHAPAFCLFSSSKVVYIDVVCSCGLKQPCMRAQCPAIHCISPVIARST